MRSLNSCFSLTVRETSEQAVWHLGTGMFPQDRKSRCLRRAFALCRPDTLPGRLAGNGFPLPPCVQGQIHRNFGACVSVLLFLCAGLIPYPVGLLCVLAGTVVAGWAWAWDWAMALLSVGSPGIGALSQSWERGLIYRNSKNM